MSYIQKNRVMIFGADVNHARVGSTRPSFAAVTGSLDADARKHAAVLQAQSPRLEIIRELSVGAFCICGVVCWVVWVCHSLRLFIIAHPSPSRTIIN